MRVLLGAQTEQVLGGQVAAHTEACKEKGEYGLVKGEKLSLTLDTSVSLSQVAKWPN